MCACTYVQMRPILKIQIFNQIILNTMLTFVYYTCIYMNKYFILGRKRLKYNHLYGIC